MVSARAAHGRGDVVAASGGSGAADDPFPGFAASRAPAVGPERSVDDDGDGDGDPSGKHSDAVMALAGECGAHGSRLAAGPAMVQPWAESGRRCVDQRCRSAHSADPHRRGSHASRRSTTRWA